MASQAHYVGNRRATAHSGVNGRGKASSGIAGTNRGKGANKGLSGLGFLSAGMRV